MIKFEKPVVFDGEKDNVVLVYSEYIIGDITKGNADLCIERIDKNVFTTDGFESIINVNDVFEYEFERDIDTQITFGTKNNEEKKYTNIDFKDTETIKKAERLLSEHFKEFGFKREEKQLTAIGAAAYPALYTLLIALGGGAFTWKAYDLQFPREQRTRIVKWWVYLFERIAEVIGYYPFLIITVIATVIGLIYMFRRMLNPPFKISVVKM